tara:strand:- start:5375 stop:6187 length:813 start_codon:yes stop_codon:yes gene_type:complete
MKVTVVTPTARPWDMLSQQAEWLKKQTMPPTEFEWVIIDDLYEERKGWVAGIETPFRIVHQPPRAITRTYGFASACNTGLVYASGKLVHFMNDYIELRPGVLERHWDIYTRWGPSVIINGPTEALPFARRGPQKVPDIMLEEGLGEVTEWPGLVFDYWSQWRKSWHAGRSDSAPLVALIEANGFDERLDGAHGGADDELGIRLRNLGCRYLLDRLVWSFDHPHEFTPKPQGKRKREWKELYMVALAKRTTEAPNSFNLTELRKEILCLAS